MSDIGIGPYSASRSRASCLMQAIRKRVQLKTELALESARIEEMLLGLTEADHVELHVLLSKEDQQADEDIKALAAEASHIAREKAEARDVTPLKVQLSRTSSRILAQEIERRLSRGPCPDLSILAEQAIRAA